MFRLLSRRHATAAKAGEHESVETLACRFDGTTAEYFGVWAVNILLTFCTLGFFKPWADARRRQYFYSKTIVGKHALGYFPNPRELNRRGTAIAVGVLCTLLSLLFLPWAALAVAGSALLLYPLYRHNALVQHAAASGYRGRRFAYSGRVLDSYLRLYAWPLLTLALGLLPLGHSLRSSWGYRIEQHRYGEERFVAKLPLGRLWQMVGLSVLALIAALGLIAAAVFAWTLLPTTVSLDDLLALTARGHLGAIHLVVGAAAVVAFSVPLALWRGMSERAVLNGSQLEAGLGFDTELDLNKFVGLSFINALAVVATLGLAAPWASIRLARYRASVSTLICYGDLESLVGDQESGLQQMMQVVGGRRGGVDHEELMQALDLGELDLPRAA